MKILVIENELSSRRGGQELSLLDVCRGLASRGHRIILFYTHSGDLERQYRLFCEEMIRVRGYSINRKHLLESGGSLGHGLWKGMRKKVDLIYTNQYLDSLFAGMLAKGTGIPFICHLRLPPPDKLCGQYRIGLSLASAFIAVSEKTRREWVDRGLPLSAIDVVYNGIDLEKFSITNGERASFRNVLGLGENTFLVTYAGRLHPAKGVETLMEAFSQIAPNGMDRRLLICGQSAELSDQKNKSRDYRSELAAKARELRIEKKIVWQEHCEKIPLLLAASDVVVLPSLWSEPFGRVIIESMACEVPAIASRVGGIPEVLAGSFSSFLFEPGSVDQLSAVLFRMMDWRRKDPLLGKQCRDYVSKKFNLEKTIEGVETCLSSRLAKFRGGRKIAVSFKNIR